MSDTDAKTGPGKTPGIKLKFLRTVQYENKGRGQGPVFEKDKTYEFAREDQARRWIRRGAAVEVGGKTLVEAEDPPVAFEVGSKEPVKNQTLKPMNVPK